MVIVDVAPWVVGVMLVGKKVREPHGLGGPDRHTAGLGEFEAERVIN